MTEKQMVSKENDVTAMGKNTPVRRLTPAVDIYETEETLVVTANLPGVARVTNS